MAKFDKESILTETDLEQLYSWLDQIPFSNPSMLNIAYDLSDGVLVAELIANFFPQFVDKRNYQFAYSSAQKKRNWANLNHNVLEKHLKLSLSESIIEQIIIAKPGAIEQVLYEIRRSLLTLSSSNSSKMKSRTNNSSTSSVRRRYYDSDGGSGSIDSGLNDLSMAHYDPRRNVASPSSEIDLNKTAAPRQIIYRGQKMVQLSKTQRKLRGNEALRTTIKQLERKMPRLNALLRIKDQRLQRLLEDTMVDSETSTLVKSEAAPEKEILQINGAIRKNNAVMFDDESSSEEESDPFSLT